MILNDELDTINMGMVMGGNAPPIIFIPENSFFCYRTEDGQIQNSGIF
jgi:hypothetical protein